VLGVSPVTTKVYIPALKVDTDEGTSGGVPVPYKIDMLAAPDVMPVALTDTVIEVEVWETRVGTPITPVGAVPPEGKVEKKTAADSVEPLLSVATDLT